MGKSAARLFDAQDDLREMIRTLAQQVETLQGGTTPGSAQPENAATMTVGVADLKNQVMRLIERVDQHHRDLTTFAPVQQNVELMEGQTERVEVRSLLSTDVMEEVDGRLAVTDVDATGQRYAKFGSMISIVVQWKNKQRNVPLKNMQQNGSPNNLQRQSRHFLRSVRGM